MSSTVYVLFNTLYLTFFVLSNSFFKNHSEMYETRTVLVLLSLVSIVAASFRDCQAQTEEKCGAPYRIEKSKSLQQQVQEELFGRWRVLVSS